MARQYIKMEELSEAVFARKGSVKNYAQISLQALKMKS